MLIMHVILFPLSHENCCCYGNGNSQNVALVGDLCVASNTWPGVIKQFSCSTQLSRKFQLLIKTKIPINEEVSCFSLSDVVFILLINVKMPTIVGILTFMSMINFVLS